MKHCVMCGSSIQRPISIGSVFSFQAVEAPVICLKCLEQFEHIDRETSCPTCSQKQMEKKQCQDCVKWAEKYQTFPPKHQALFTYNEMARQFMHQFKYQGDVVLGLLFKEMLSERLKKYTHTHTIVPIPLSRRAEQTRGFNPVEVLLKQADLPFESRLLYVDEGEKPFSKTKEESLQSQQPFKLNSPQNCTAEKPFLIVDEVYTTGMTLYHARVLLGTIGKTETFSLFR